MKRMNKTIKNLQEIWDKLDGAYELMEDAFEALESMSGIPDDLKKEMDRFDLSSISSLKQQIEMIMQEKESFDKN